MERLNALLLFSDIKELGDIIRNSRALELKDFPETAKARHIDPMSEEAFLSCTLNWDERSSPASADMLELYRKLLRLRSAILTPRLIGIGGNSGSSQILGSLAFQVRWTLGDGSILNLAANLGVSSQKGDWQAVVPLWCEGTFTDDTLGPYTALFWLT